MPEQRESSRLEEQIRQILEQAEREPRWRRWLRRVPRARPYQVVRSFPGRRRTVIDSTWAWLAGTFGLALLAILVAEWSRTLATLVAIGSLVVFFAPIVTGFRGRAVDVPGSRRWRGRDIDLPPRPYGIGGRVRYWLWRLRQRR